MCYDVYYALAHSVITTRAWLRRLSMKRGFWVKQLWFLLLLGNNRGLVSGGLVSCHPLYLDVCVTLFLLV
jgi:hypothetical protein